MEDKQPKVTFIPLFRMGLEKSLEVRDGKLLTLSFLERQKLDPELATLIKDGVSQILQEGYNYISDITNGELKLSHKFKIEFSNRKSGHAAQGILIRIHTPSIVKLVQEPNNEKLQKLERSLLFHELIHNVTDDEEFPMFIEIIYMLENGQYWRFESMGKLLEENKFKPEYVQGLKNISEWLGYKDSKEMLDLIRARDVNELKSIFKQKILDYYKKEIESLNKEKTP